MTRQVKNALVATGLDRDLRTTLAGAIGAGLLVAGDLVQSGQTDYKVLLTAAAIAAIGYLAGDRK